MADNQSESAVAALVYSYLKDKDPKVAEAFKQKTNAVTNIVLIFFSRTLFCPVIELCVDAVSNNHVGTFDHRVGLHSFKRKFNSQDSNVEKSMRHSILFLLFYV